MLNKLSTDELSSMLPKKFNTKYENGKLYPYKGAILSLTYHCNTDVCEYCYARSQKILGTMDTEKFTELLTWISGITDFRLLHFLGGEPTTISNLKDYYDIAHQFGFEINLYTNGKFEPHIGELLKTHPASKYVVFHYEPLMFEKFRGFRNTFFSNIKELSNSDKELGIIYMIHKTDFAASQEVIETAQTYNMELRWMIAPPGPKYDKYLTLDQLKSMRGEIQKFLLETMERGIHSTVDMATPLCIFDEDFLLEYGQQLNLIKMCSPYIYVKPDLSTQYCTQLPQFKTPPLKSTEDLRNAILASRERLPEIRKKIPFKECESCRLYNVICQGGCHDYKFYS